MTRFVIVFMLTLVSLFTLEMLTPVQEHLIIPFTGMLASISAGIIAPFDSSIISYGKILQFGPSGFSVSIEAGCNGIEATIVLIAAVIAFPGTWRTRIAGIGLGFFAIQAVNIMRIISLLYLGNWNIDIFSWVHLYLWPVLIMLDVLIVLMVYSGYMSGRARQAEPAHA